MDKTFYKNEISKVQELIEKVNTVEQPSEKGEPKRSKKDGAIVVATIVLLIIVTVTLLTLWLIK